MYVLKFLRIGLLISLVAPVLSCDVAGGLFSQSELAAMYEVRIENDGLALADGDLVRSDSFLVPVIDSHSSVSGPEKLSLALIDMEGIEVALLVFVSESGSLLDTEDSSLQAVRSMQGPLPSFSIPDNLNEGYYYLETRLYDSAGHALSSSRTLVLVYNGAAPAPWIETFPSSPAKGQPVFLRLVSGMPEGFDPWLRWYVGGLMRKEGYVSDFADRLVWQIRETDGFFNVKAEVFPFKPPAAFSDLPVSAIKSHLSSFRADLILAVGPARAASPFDGIERAYSVDFKSDPEIQTVVIPGGTVLPALMMGSPYLESHEYGYGHAMKAGSGYLLPGTIIPRNGTAFTLGIAFEPEDDLGASGSLVTLYDAEGTTSLMRLGVSGGLPYLEVGDSIVQAFTGLPAGLSQLVLEVIPPGEDSIDAVVSLFLNNELVGNGVIPGSLFALDGSIMTLIGGPEGLEAVYDELAVIEGRYQAFFVAKAHEFGSSLVAASGFEGGAIGRGITVQGTAVAGEGFIELSLDSSLDIPVPGGGITVDLEGYGVGLELVLVMDDGSSILLHTSTTIPEVQPEADHALAGTNPGGVETQPDGTVDLDAVAATGSGSMEVDPEETTESSSLEPDLSILWFSVSDQSLSLSVELVAEGLRITDAFGRDETIPTTLSATMLRVQCPWPDLLTIETVMVRTISATDSINRIANEVPAPQLDAVF